MVQNNNDNATTGNEHEVVDRMIQSLESATTETRESLLRRAGIMSEQGELTALYGGEGKQAPDSMVQPDETLGYATDSEGNRYELEFYGYREKAAVITPNPPSGAFPVLINEVIRKPAQTAEEARKILEREASKQGWTLSWRVTSQA